jgi:hypothetical protein
MIMVMTIISMLMITITVISFVSVQCGSSVMIDGRIEMRTMWRRAINILVL